jgi:hypothetical protein
MCIIPVFMSLIGMVVLVTLGYLALWTSNHENTPKGLAGFGKVMSIILFVFAGLALVGGATASHMCMWYTSRDGGSCAVGRWMPGRHMGAMMKENEEMEEHEHMGMADGNEPMTKENMVDRLKTMRDQNPDLFNQSMTELNKPQNKK